MVNITYMVKQNYLQEKELENSLGHLFIYSAYLLMSMCLPQITGTSHNKSQKSRNYKLS